MNRPRGGTLTRRSARPKNRALQEVQPHANEEEQVAAYPEGATARRITLLLVQLAVALP